MKNQVYTIKSSSNKFETTEFDNIDIQFKKKFGHKWLLVRMVHIRYNKYQPNIYGLQFNMKCNMYI